MPERSTISQVVQVGVETTSGVAVAASKRLASLSIEPSPNVEVSSFRPQGTKFQTLAVLGKEWTESGLSGRATYDEIIYPLSSVLGAATITTPAGGTLSRQWKFKPSPIDEDLPKTFTVEQGSAVRAHRFVYGLVTELGLGISRDAIEVSGSMMGRALEDGVTLTADPTSVPLVPVLPDDVCVYLDNTAAGIGATKLTRVVGVDWSIGDRFGPLWTIDCAEPSWAAHVETEPSLTAGLTMEADAVGMGLLATMRTGATKYLRIQATGGIIEAAIPYSLTIDMPVKIVDTGGFSDEDGVFGVQWDFNGVADSTFDGDTGGAVTVTVVNTQTAL